MDVIIMILFYLRARDIGSCYLASKKFHVLEDGDKDVISCSMMPYQKMSEHPRFVSPIFRKKVVERAIRDTPYILDSKFYIENAIHYNLLDMFCSDGYLDLVMIAIAHGVEMTQNAIYAVCRKGHGDILDILLGYEVSYNRHHALLKCAGNGHLDLFKLLLDGYEGVDLEQIFVEASYCGHRHILQYMTENYDIPHETYEQGLFSACENNKLEVVKWLLQKHPRVKHGKDSVFIWAVSDGYVKLTELLYNHSLEFGAPIEMELLVTAMEIACADGRLELVEWLCELGVDIHAHEELFFRIACRKGYLPIVKYLISIGVETGHKVDIFAQERKAFLAENEDVIDYLKMLVESGEYTG